MFMGHNQICDIVFLKKVGDTKSNTGLGLRLFFKLKRF